ncbi:MAG TPA: MerR family DNA-binding transcriptional regulator [Cyanobacteria bacterium UBA8530]|nr:MerR family DNA-binding transcriptional regulator [Cyanobacteria bacterium UBA8530]
MHSGTWKVGEIAKRTQLSVRTLHYYEEVGLLRPSARTEAGHRLYTEADVVRLQRILSLRQLGFSLDDIRNSLDSPDYSLAPVLDLHLARLTCQEGSWLRQATGPELYGPYGTRQAESSA